MDWPKITDILTNSRLKLRNGSLTLTEAMTGELDTLTMLTKEAHTHRSLRVPEANPTLLTQLLKAAIYSTHL